MDIERIKESLDREAGQRSCRTEQPMSSSGLEMISQDRCTSVPGWRKSKGDSVCCGLQGGEADSVDLSELLPKKAATTGEVEARTGPKASNMNMN
jgi:hypothetical protein